MNIIDKRIVSIIKRHHVLNLATCLDAQPYCASCFYTFIEDKAVFIFTSDKNTRHSGEMTFNPRVAGTITLETKIIGKIQGVQFTGNVLESLDIEHEWAKKAYLKRFPYAAPFVKDECFWILEADFIKLTDNRLGYGTKLFWHREG